MNKEDIRVLLKDHASNVIFNEEEHTYTYKNKPLVPVSETLAWYKKGLKNIPKPHLDNAIHRGNVIHAILENYLERKYILNEDYSLEQSCEDNLFYKSIWSKFIDNANSYINRHLEDKWEILSVEQLLYDNSVGIAGTVDLLMIRIIDNNIEIKISDWKTGNLRVSNYAQIAIYHRLLKRVLVRKKIDNFTITTQLISLKDNEIS